MCKHALGNDYGRFGAESQSYQSNCEYVFGLACKVLRPEDFPDFDPYVHGNMRTEHIDPCFRNGLTPHAEQLMCNFRNHLTTLRLDSPALSSGFFPLGFMRFKNEIQDSALDIIGEVKAGGVRPVMLTGDNVNTAQSIASECGLFRSMNNSNHAAKTILIG